MVPDEEMGVQPEPPKLQFGATASGSAVCHYLHEGLLGLVENESSLPLSLLFTRLNKPAPLTPCR